MPSLEEKKTPANKKQKKTPKENPSPKEKDTPVEEENEEVDIVEAPASDEASTSTTKRKPKRKQRSDKNGTRMKVQQVRVQNNVRQVYINGQWRELEPTKVRNVVWCVFIPMLLGEPASYCSV